MQKDENQSDRIFYFECFDGNSKYTHDRIGRGIIEIINCTLSIIAGIQHSRIVPIIHKAKWEWIDKKPNVDAAKNYEKIFHDFPILHFTEKAQQLFRDWDKQIKVIAHSENIYFF